MYIFFYMLHYLTLFISFNVSASLFCEIFFSGSLFETAILNGYSEMGLRMVAQVIELIQLCLFSFKSETKTRHM